MIAYAVVLCVAKLLSAFPLRWALALGRVLGGFTFYVLRIRRRLVLDNLRHVFGDELSRTEITAIGREAYRQCALTFVEVLRSSGTAPSGFERNVTYDSLGFFEELKASGSPVVIMQPHLGNFDLAAYAFAMQGVPLHTVMKKIRNPRLNRLIVETREQHNITVHLKSKETYPKLLEVLRGGGWLGVLPDQRTRRDKGVEVDFLGKPARIFPGPAVFHLETGARLCLAWNERLEDPCRHHVHLHPIPPHPATGDRDADVKAIMQEVADAMGEAIRKTPGQYFWFHRLWGKEIAASSPRSTT